MSSKKNHKPDIQADNIGVVGDQSHIEGGVHFDQQKQRVGHQVNVAGNYYASVLNHLQAWRRAHPWHFAVALVGALLLTVLVGTALAGAVSPDIRQTLFLQGLWPRAFPKEQEDQVLIVIAQFHYTEGIADTAAHNEIKRAIEQEADNLNLRVEVTPICLTADDRAGAQALGARYDASLVIWGAETGVRVSVNFYNHKQPQATAADVQIEETARTQLAAPSEYAEFITCDLPSQLTFLALFALGQSYYAEEAYTESTHIIEKAVTALGNQENEVEGVGEAYFRLGWLYQVSFDNLEKAHAAYTHAIELAPYLADAYVNRGIIHSETGEYSKAEADFTRAIEVDPQDAVAYNNRGVNYREMGEYDRAKVDYTHAIELDPNYTSPYNNRGNIYNIMGEYDKAEADYTHVIELDPEYAKAYYNRGVNYNAMGKYDKAEADFTRAIELDPEYAEAYNNRGVIYNDMGKYAQAEADYTHAIELNPDYAEAFNNRGIIYNEMGEYDKAEADYTRAIALDPKYAKAYNNRGSNYNAMGKYDKAKADFTRAIELDPEYTKAFANRGNNYNDIGDYDKAEADYTRAIELDPEYTEAYNNRGNNYNDMGEYAKAERDYTQAIELDPDFAIVYNNRGDNYNDMGKYEAALADFERAANLMPHPIIYYNGAQAHAQLGHVEDACAWLEEAIVLDGQRRERARTDTAFDPIRDAPCFQALIEEN